MTRIGPIQWLHGLYRPDRYEYQMELSRVAALMPGVGQQELSLSFTNQLKENAMSTRRHFMSQSAVAVFGSGISLVGGGNQDHQNRCVASSPGALAYSGQQCREGALMAIEDINKAGASSRWEAPVRGLAR